MKKKKLKRGLKDISPIFHDKKSEEKTRACSSPTTYHSKPKAPENYSVKPALEAQKIEALKKFDPVDSTCLSVFCPSCPGDSLFIETYLASEFMGMPNPRVIYSLHPEAEDHSKVIHKGNYSSGQEGLHHLSLPAEDFLKMLEKPENNIFDQKEPGTEPIVFLDFEPARMRSCRNLFHLVDKWILHMQSSLESMVDCYKLVKAVLPVNPHAEFYLLFDGASDDVQAIKLYEKFSELLSKHFGIQIIWFGCFQVSEKKTRMTSGLAVDQLFLKTSMTKNRQMGQGLRQVTHEMLDAGERLAV